MGLVASPCNQVIIRWFVRAIMSVATSVAALVATQEDRDCQRAVLSGAASERRGREKNLRALSQRRVTRLIPVEAFSLFISLGLLDVGVIIQKLTAVTES